MATEVIIPALGVVVEQVKIVKWLKLEGERVMEGEPLLEIESEKVTTEIPSPTSGVLGCILYPEGAEVPITKVVAVIVDEGEAVPDIYRQQVVETPSAGMPMAAFSAKSIKAAPAAGRLAEEKGINLARIRPTGPHGTIMKKDVEAYLASWILKTQPQKVSTLARKEAERLHVPLESLHGTGVRGRIMKTDVLKAVERSKPVFEEISLLGKVIPMNKMRQVIARRMCESAFTAPHTYFYTEVNMDKVLNLRRSMLEEFEKQFQVRLSVNDFMIKAVALAIVKYPLFNATLKGNEIHIHSEINIGLAVALDDGLIVPAIPKVNKLSLGAIAKIRVDLVERARKGDLTINEVQRGTFTISSLAGFDITFFTAILNPPQSGILTLGKTQDGLYLENGEVKMRKLTVLGLSVDHRIIDGILAAKFLQTIKIIIENPNFTS